MVMIVLELGLDQITSSSLQHYRQISIIIFSLFPQIRSSPNTTQVDPGSEYFWDDGARVRDVTAFLCICGRTAIVEKYGPQK